MGYGHDQGFYYPSGTGTSRGPQVGPSMSACFEYDNPLTQELSGLTARMGAIELHQEELGHSLDQGFKSQPGTTGFLVFFPFLVRSGMVNRVRSFIFYASKSKNTKVIFLCYCSGFEQCHRFLKP